MLSNLPVIVVERNIINNILENDFVFMIDKFLEGNCVDYNEYFLKYKLRIIPFSSIGNNNGIIIGIKPDSVIINDEEYEVRKEAYIGIYDGKLSDNKEYNAIVGLL